MYRMSFIEKLQKAIHDESTAANFYKKLMEETDHETYRDFIKHAYEDEVKHYYQFQQLHYLLTGSFYDAKPDYVEYSSLKEAALIALEDELEAAEFYREMLFEIPDQRAYYPLFVAMTDELEHATRFSVIYNSEK